MKHSLSISILMLICHSITSQVVNPSFKPLIEGLPEITLIKNLPNDKVIVTGTFTSVQDVPNKGFVLLNADGSIDENFSTEIIELGKGFGGVFDVAFDSENDKYYVAGSFDNLEAINRLNNDGSLDESFELDTQFSTISHIGLQSDGKLIIITNSELGIARLNTDGSLDETFNNDSGFNENSSLESDLIILDNDKILFGGAFTTFNNESVTNLIQLNADGSVDESFDFTGLLSASSGLPFINSVLPLSNGDIILAGSFDSIYGNTAKSLGRINADGSFEETFTLPGAGANLFNRSVRAILDHNDNILVSGIDSNIDNYSLIRLDSDGVLDPNFTTGSIEFNNSLGYLIDPVMAISSEGEIYYSSFYTHYDGIFTQSLSKLDASGKVIDDYIPDVAGKASLAVSTKMTDGSVFIGGRFTSVNNQSMSFFAKLMEDGTVDSQFMENVGDGPDLTVGTIEEDNNGNILVAGGFRNFNNESTGSIVRLSSEGIRDTSFDPRVFSNFVGPGVHDIIVIDSDHIFIGGSFYTADNQTIYNLAKINNDGTLDITFDLELSTDASIDDMELLDNETLFYSGNIGYREGVVLGKVDIMGNVDSNFEIVYDFTDQSIIHSSVMPGTGDILISISSDNGYKLAQFEADGTFKNDVAIGVTGSSGISTILPLDSENILIGGQFSNVNGVRSPGLAKVSLDGSVDEAFNYELVEIGNFSGPSVSSITDLGSANYLISGNFAKGGTEDLTSIAIINTQVPRAPSNLSGSFSFSTGVSLTWDDNSSIETGFELYRKSTEDTFDLVGTLDADQNSYIDENVSLATSYSYRVRAINGDLTSSYSSEIEVVVDDLFAPTDLSFEFNYVTGTILSWINSSDTEGSIEIFRTEEGGEFISIAQFDANVQSYEDIQVNLNATYGYYIKVLAGIYEVQSEEATYVTPGSAMLSVPVLTLDQSSENISLNWEYETSEIVGFNVYGSEGNDSEFQSLSIVEGNEYSISDVQQGVLYTYKIVALNSFEASEFSNEVTLLILGTDELANDFQVQPNPVTSEFQIISTLSKGTYEVLDLNGKIVKEGNVNQNVNVSSLPNGVYVTKIYVGNEVVTRKFIISRK